MYYGYYHEPTTLNSPFFGYLLIFLIFGFFVFRYFLLWFIKSKNEKTKYKILKFTVILSPIWIPILLFFSLIGVNSILSNQISLFAIPSTLFLCVFFYLYYLIAAYPASVAYDIINILNDVFGAKDKNRVLTFWSLLDKLKQKRLLIIYFLIIALSLVSLLDVYFLSKIINHQSDVLISDYGFLSSLLAISLISLLIYAVIEIFNYGKVNISRTEHKKFINLKKVIEKLSLTTGVTAPDFQILAYNNPTAFSIFPNFGKPTVYITAPLLNMADDNELEAVIGHEFAHIFSGRILYFKRIHNLLIILRALAFFLFFLFLLSINPFLVICWFALLGYFCINVLEQVREKKFFLETMFKLFNPPLALINFLSYFIYYGIARNEEFYADLKTIEFTRYPKGIYSILQKLGNYTDIKQRLPNRFSYLYFTAEDTTFDEIPMPQPLIDEREEALRETDADLKTSEDIETDKSIKCPYCKSLMDSVAAKGFYYDLKANYCKKCESFWFVDGNLWYVRDLNFNNIDSKEKDVKEVKIKGELLCPRCGVNLRLFKDNSFPSDIKIWYCPICNGDWLSRKDVFKYLTYKKKFIGK